MNTAYSKDQIRVSELFNKRDLLRLGPAVDQSFKNLAEGQKIDSQVKELSDFTFSRNKTLLSQTELYFTLPMGALAPGRRALDPGTGSTGGYLVGHEIAETAEVLRPDSIAILLGNTVENLVGNYSIPLELTQFTSFDWYHSQDTIVSTTGSLGQLAFTPHRIGGTINVDKQLLKQAPVTESLVLTSARKSIAAKIDSGFFTGIGAAGQPQGVFSLNGVQTETFGGAASLAKVVDFQTLCLNKNGKVRSLAYAANPNVRAKWQTVQEFSGSSFGLWHFDETVAGRPGFVTTNIAVNNVVLGDFSSAYTCFWGIGSPVEFILDPFTSKKSGVLEIVVQSYADVGVTQPSQWIINADSAVQ